MLAAVLTLTLLTQPAPLDLIPEVPEVAEAFEVEEVSLPDPAEFTTHLTGYLDSRVTGAHVRVGRPVPPNDTPSLANRTEANVQLKLKWGSTAQLLADAAFYYQDAWAFYGRDPATHKRQSISNHDVVNYRPLAVINELYVTGNPRQDLNITLGKKRVVWGPGLTSNPMDLLNPPKDPTDPNNQRSGAWLLRFEVPRETVTFTALAAAQVLRQYGGVPSALVVYPDYPTSEAQADAFADDRDNQAHYALALRAYTLVAQTDINVAYYFTNLYGDAFENKSRVGVSASRYVLDPLELHVEALFQRGSQRTYVNASCVQSQDAATACALAQTPSATLREIDSPTIRPRVLAGARYDFPDESSLTVEYLYYGDGYSKADYRSWVRKLVLARQNSDAGLALDVNSLGLGGGGNPGSPQNFSFLPNRQHYLIASYQKPRIADDFTARVVVLFNMQDLSGQISPGINWSARPWLSLDLAGFVGVSGIDSLGAEAFGRRYGEYELSPVDYRVIASARAFY